MKPEDQLILPRRTLLIAGQAGTGTTTAMLSLLAATNPAAIEDRTSNYNQTVIVTRSYRENAVLRDLYQSNYSGAPWNHLQYIYSGCHYEVPVQGLKQVFLHLPDIEMEVVAAGMIALNETQLPDEVVRFLWKLNDPKHTYHEPRIVLATQWARQEVPHA